MPNARAGTGCGLEPWLLTLHRGSQACTAPGRMKGLVLSTSLYPALLSIKKKKMLCFKAGDKVSRGKKRGLILT